MGIPHLRRCEDGESWKTAQPLTFDVGEELVTCKIHGVHVRRGPTGAENTITFCPTNQLPKPSQHLILNQNKHWGHLIGKAVIKVKYYQHLMYIEHALI